MKFEYLANFDQKPKRYTLKDILNTTRISKISKTFKNPLDNKTPVIIRLLSDEN